ncbi:polysaccharide deacetylase family protein [Pseudoduganella sp. UC29_71]|uniref:polysaccharide deacetylase family protein n=1 Tax=Pseudoduganella sp. UC29_71 TaxID=3350174 RepID=UPI00366B89D0
MTVTTQLAALARRSLLRLGALGRARRSLSILIYHRVLPAPDPLFPDEVDAARFEQQMAWLKQGFRVMPLAEAARRLREGTLPPRAACVTFDDGYADNAEIALPILQRHGVPATFFVATGFLNGGRMWNDTVIELVRRAPGPRLELAALDLGSHALDSDGARTAAIQALLDQLKYLEPDARLTAVERLRSHLGLALPDDLMMNTAQLRRLHAAGMEIGAHTVHHPILASMDEHGARQEIARGKAALEDMTGAPVRLFAYPNGKPGRDYHAAHVALARELGFEAAVCTSWGAAGPDADLYQLPRFTPWDRKPLGFTLRLLHNLYRPGQTV